MQMQSEIYMTYLTGQGFILGSTEDKFYISSITEGRSWREIEEDIYNEFFESPLVRFGHRIPCPQPTQSKRGYEVVGMDISTICYI